MGVLQRQAFSPMEPRPATCPPWLAHHLKQAGGRVPFRQYMDWVLNDPHHGFYGAGRGRIGPRGDFVTSPSLGPDFAALLASQIDLWLEQLQQLPGTTHPLSLVEVGPGEGDLAADLIDALHTHHPRRLDHLELILVESNPAMRQRQQQRLSGERRIPVRWCSFDQLKHDPVCGVVLAHELLDALPVDRLVWRHGAMELQGVALQTDGTLAMVNVPIPEELNRSIQTVTSRCGVELPPSQAPEGWTTEWHTCQESWLRSLAEAIRQGVLLVVDYAMEARRYYDSRRLDGTLLCYRQQQASSNPLQDPGLQDLTAHLCMETLDDAAIRTGWQVLDHARQGEALLALGLAERLHGLQTLPPSELAQALQRREALLRLVDPHLLGEFRWLLYGWNVPKGTFSLSVATDSQGSPPG